MPEVTPKPPLGGPGQIGEVCGGEFAGARKIRRRVPVRPVTHQPGRSGAVSRAWGDRGEIGFSIGGSTDAGSQVADPVGREQ